VEKVYALSGSNRDNFRVSEYEGHFYLFGDMLFKKVSVLKGKCEHSEPVDLMRMMYRHFLGWEVDNEAGLPRHKNFIEHTATSLPIAPYSQPRIPHILHYVWVTEGLTKRPMKEEYYEFIRKGREVLESRGNKWRQLLWVNRNVLRFPEMLERLARMGVEVHLIEELEFINGRNHKQVLDHVNKMITKIMFGSGPDLIRQLALLEFGGVYNDLDNQLKNNIDWLTYYDSFVGDSMTGAGIGFVGQIPNHPILQRSLEIA
jgi:hypothetical protein